MSLDYGLEHHRNLLYFHGRVLDGSISVSLNLKLFFLSPSNSPPHLGKFQMPHLQGMDDSLMLVDSMRRGMFKL